MFFIMYETMAHGYAKVRKYVCYVLIGLVNFLVFSFKYWRCSLKVHL